METSGNISVYKNYSIIGGNKTNRIKHRPIGYRNAETSRKLAFTWKFLVWQGASSKDENSSKVYNYLLKFNSPIVHWFVEEDSIVNSKMYMGWGKKPRTSMKKMQQRKAEGGIAFLNIQLNYQAALLEVLSQWWNGENTNLRMGTRSRGSIEGVCFELLCVRDCPPLKSKSLVIDSLPRFWKKLQHQLAPGISPLASFCWHPDFSKLHPMFNCSI